MGTDIHLQVEVRDEDGWKISPRKPFKIYGDEGFSWDEDPSGRHYDLFAFLADVRNGYGFAGVVRGSKIDPQFSGRGLPKDYADPKRNFNDEDEEDEAEGTSSHKLLSDSEHVNTSGAPPKKRPSTEYTGGDFWLGDHSFTYATLEELQECNWNVLFKSTGYVGLVDYLEFKKNGMPNSWCGDVSGLGIKKFEDPASFEAYMAKAATKAGFTKIQDQDHLARLLDNKEVAGAHVRIVWEWQPLANCRFKKWIFGDMMQGLADEFGGPQNVRVIMGFDS